MVSDDMRSRILIDQIRTHAAEAAAVGDFDAVAATLSAKTVIVRVGKVGGKATLGALVASGKNPNEVIAAMRSVPMASELLDTLTVSGVDWGDNLTKHVMEGLVAAGKITADVVTIVQGLSTRIDSPAGRTVTADECREAWQADRLSARITNATALAGERIKPDDTPEQQAEVWASCWKDGV